ncbi:MAG: methionyl-tRNA formyltransferase [Pyrinomonadaceae bacterium]|nr:methionyl-tRNA formyltransferase [Pyrinomonadaceae bacterium]
MKKRKIVFMGTPAAAVPSLERIVSDGHEVLEVWTQPDRPKGRGRKLTPPPVKSCAERLGLRVFQPEKIKTKAVRARFKALNADVAVVVAYGRILTKTYLESFPMGSINVHFSLLPKYRGAAPVNWAIAKGETKTGVTTMQMDRGLDTGDILLVKELDILENETSPELMERLAALGADAISETLRDYEEIEPVPQNNDEATMAPLFEKTDGRINWQLSAKEIADRIRGFQPFPRSFSTIESRTVTFWAAVVDNATTDEAPGRILKADDDELLISCGRGTVLKVLELQVPGKARTKTREFLNGERLRQGLEFSNE